MDSGLWTAFGAAVDIRRGDLDDPLAGVIRLAIQGDRPIDVIVGNHPWQTRAIERAERVPGGPPVVQTRDLILLKLYAGGSQDLWDIRELLQLDPAVASDVSADVQALSAAFKERWDSVRRG